MEIRQFAKDILNILSKEDQDVKHIVMTFNGVYSGLDKIEAYFSLFAEIGDYLQNQGTFLKLKQITLIDSHSEHNKRFKEILNFHHLKSGYIKKLEKDWEYLLTFPTIQFQIEEKKLLSDNSEINLSDIPFSISYQTSLSK